MDQLLLFAREISRVEHRFRYKKTDRKGVFVSKHLDRDLADKVRTYKEILKRAERNIFELRIGCYGNKKDIKKLLIEALQEHSEDEKFRIKENHFDISFYPIAIVGYFKNGHDAAAYMDPGSYGLNLLIESPICDDYPPVAIIMVGKRRNWIYHEYIHVFNNYRHFYFGEIPYNIDELSAYMLACPATRLKLLDKQRLVDLAVTHGLSNLKEEFSLDIRRSVSLEPIPETAISNAIQMLGPILDKDTRVVARVIAKKDLTEKQIRKELTDQHPFMHLNGDKEVLFIASSLISLVRGESYYTYKAIAECAAFK